MTEKEQQAFEDAFDDGVEEGKLQSEDFPMPENGRNYYNQTYKS